MQEMDKIAEFLKYRQKFTNREWFELNQAVNDRLKEKADQLELDDFDLQVIAERVNRYL